MIILEMAQGSPEWIAARIGIPTASQFHRLVTPKKLEPAAAADGLLAEKVGEWLLGAQLDEDVTKFMERGHELEPEAIRFYELQRDVDVRRVGFVMRDDRQVGCSPDFLVGEDGGGEVKCPGPRKHMEYVLFDLPDTYRLQVQGNLWLTGRRWWDFVSYHPNLPFICQRYERDEKVIGLLADAVENFLFRLEGQKARLRGEGHGPVEPPKVEPKAPPEEPPPPAAPAKEQELPAAATAEPGALWPMDEPTPEKDSMAAALETIRDEVRATLNDDATPEHIRTLGLTNLASATSVGELRQIERTAIAGQKRRRTKDVGRQGVA